MSVCKDTESLTGQRHGGEGPSQAEETSFFFFFLIYIFFNFILFIYLFLAALGLCCCARAFSSCREWRLLFVVVCRLLIAVASLVAEPGL